MLRRDYECLLQHQRLSPWQLTITNESNGFLPDFTRLLVVWLCVSVCLYFDRARSLLLCANNAIQCVRVQLIKCNLCKLEYLIDSIDTIEYICSLCILSIPFNTKNKHMPLEISPDRVQLYVESGLHSTWHALHIELNIW